MSEESSIIMSPAQSADPAWDRARQWVKIATQHEYGKLMAQVMTGLELIALQKRFNIRRGHPKKELRQIGGIDFKDLMAKELPIPRRTAQRWMRMARFIIKRVETMAVPDSVRAALAGSPVHCAPGHAEQFAQFVNQVTQGRTQSDLLPPTERKRLASARGSATSFKAIPALTTRKSSPAMRLMAEYVESFPREAELLDEIERLEKVLHLCRQWLMTEFGQRDFAVLRAQLNALCEAA